MNLIKPVIKILILTMFCPKIYAATFTVINTNNSGVGSLNQAILDSNGTPGPNNINFNIPSGPFVISPTTDLPTITVPVTINGINSDGSRVTISSAGSANGFTINSGGSGSTITGFSIINFSNAGINLQVNANNCTISNNYIGLNASGGAAGNFNGVVAAALNTLTIGGPTTASRNIISGNTRTGLDLGNVTNVTIENNFIGTNLTGTSAIPNDSGVALDNFTPGITNSIVNNTISGNKTDGIRIAQGMNNIIQGNYIGVASDGISPLGNGIGIFFNQSASNNLVGGLNPSLDANIIAYNTKGGIEVTNNSVKNAILGNNIFNNNNTGISLITGGNDNQSAPVLTSSCLTRTTLTIKGTSPAIADSGTSMRIQFFENNSSNITNEGQRYIGSDLTGIAASTPFTATITGFTPSYSPSYLSATATINNGSTSSTGDTSQFSSSLQTDTINVAIFPTTQVVCTNGTIRFSAVITGGIGTFNYIWTGPNGFSQNTGTNPNLSISNPSATNVGSYFVTVTDSNGCQAMSTASKVSVKNSNVPCS